MISKTPFMAALRIGFGDVVSVAGSGGKVTLMYHIGREAAQTGQTVITTSSTHLHPPTSQQTGGLFVLDETPDWPHIIPGALQKSRHLAVVGARPRPDKLLGLDIPALGHLRETCRPDLMLIKADGARNRPFKAPGENEPVVPSWTTCGIVVVGLQSLGLPMDERHTHRPERVMELSGVRPGQAITPEVIAAVVGAPQAYLAAFPTGIPIHLYLGWADTPARLACAEKIAKRLSPERFSGIFCGSIERDRQSITAL
jgi:probable selenium-dependent hydroxylase accessory protein YqeC